MMMFSGNKCHVIATQTELLVTLLLLMITFLQLFSTTTAFTVVPTVGSRNSRWKNPAVTTTIQAPSSYSSSSSLHLFDLLNEGKKALVRNMAGEYDAVAVRKLMGCFCCCCCCFDVTLFPAPALINNSYRC
jgi:hypothetical protein